MIYRNQDGLLVEINRLDCKNDHIYYKKIIDCKKRNALNDLELEKGENLNLYSTTLISKIVR